MASPTDPKTETIARVAPLLPEPGLERRRPRLVSIHGAHLGKRWAVEACGVVIGRDSAQAGLALPDPAVKGRHCARELEPATGEFLAFLHPLELSRGLELAELIRARVAAHEFERDGVQVHPTISIGIAQLHPGLPTPDHLLQAADEALYRAKRAGRNQVSR